MAVSNWSGSRRGWYEVLPWIPNKVHGTAVTEYHMVHLRPLPPQQIEHLLLALQGVNIPSKSSESLYPVFCPLRKGIFCSNLPELGLALLPLFSLLIQTRQLPLPLLI